MSKSTKPHFAQDATPVIIAGAPRSGTTFLTTLLNSHPQVMITNELRFWSFANDIRRRTREPSELLPEHPLREPLRDFMLKAYAKQFQNFYKNHVNIDNLGCSSNGGDSVDPIIRAYGDKNPGYADTHSPDCLNFISKSLPRAKFLHVVRDPRSCVASYLRIPVYSNEIDRCINVWKRHTESMLMLEDKLGPERVLRFRYEDLVKEGSENVFKMIEKHINVDAAQEPLTFLKRERNSPTPYRAPTTPNDKLGRTTFKDRLTAEQIRQINDACGHLIDLEHPGS